MTTQQKIRNTRATIRDNFDQQSSNTELPKPSLDPAEAKKRIVAMANLVKAHLLNIPLANGLMLHAATKEDLQAQIERYESQGAKMLFMARWLRLILPKVPNGKCVGDVMTEDQARQLYERAKMSEAA